MSDDNEQIAMTDQNGTAHLYARDPRGRVTQDTVSAFGTNIDDHVKAIETTYDDFGRTLSVQSLSATPAVLNEVRFAYTSLWQVDHVDQSHDGAVTYDMSGDPSGVTRRVAYEYETIPASGTGDTRNVSRASALVHPDGSKVIHGYGGSTSPDTRSSRVRSIALEESGAMPPPAVTVADYAFTGWSVPVTIEYPVPGVRLDRHSADNGVSTAGSYTGYDRFGRVLRQKWVDDAGRQLGYSAEGESATGFVMTRSRLEGISTRYVESRRRSHGGSGPLAARLSIPIACRSTRQFGSGAEHSRDRGARLRV